MLAAVYIAGHGCGCVDTYVHVWVARDRCKAASMSVLCTAPRRPPMLLLWHLDATSFIIIILLSLCLLVRACVHVCMLCVCLYKFVNCIQPTVRDD